MKRGSEAYRSGGEVVQHHVVVLIANTPVVAVRVVADVKEKELERFEDHRTLFFASCDRSTWNTCSR